MKSPLIKCLFYSILLIFLSQLIKNTLKIDQLLYNTMAEGLTSQQLNRFFELQNKLKWISYIFIPVYVIIKTSIIGIITYIGIYLFSQREIEYKLLWNITVKAEFIFLLVPLFKFFWFLFFQTKYDLNDVQNFYPLSALNITGYKDLEIWFIYPFQVLNLFELFYILYLGFEIGKLTQTNTDYGLKIVSLSYVPSLLLWIVTVMFFTVNYS